MLQKPLKLSSESTVTGQRHDCLEVNNLVNYSQDKSYVDDPINLVLFRKINLCFNCQYTKTSVYDKIGEMEIQRKYNDNMFVVEEYFLFMTFQIFSCSSKFSDDIQCRTLKRLLSKDLDCIEMCYNAHHAKGFMPSKAV